MEVVQIERTADLRPMDMVEEGVFIHDLTAFNGDPGPTEWTVAPCSYEVVDEYNGQPIRALAWGEPLDRPLTVPLRVIRGVAPPAR